MTLDQPDSDQRLTPQTRDTDSFTRCRACSAPTGASAFRITADHVTFTFALCNDHALAALDGLSHWIDLRHHQLADAHTPDTTSLRSPGQLPVQRRPTATTPSKSSASAFRARRRRAPAQPEGGPSDRPCVSTQLQPLEGDETLDKIRTWARQHSLPVAAAGSVSRRILDAYRTAHTTQRTSLCT